MRKRFKDYIKPDTLEGVFSSIENAPDESQIIAGGTDLLLERSAKIEKGKKILIDIGGIEDISKITIKDKELAIGAGVKLADIECSKLVREDFPILVQGVKEVGSPQIRNLATIGGNLCNGSPAADTVPALLVLDAIVEIASSQGVRDVPLTEFHMGPSQTILNRNEILTLVKIPEMEKAFSGNYHKLKTREALDLAFVGVAVLLIDHRDTIEARIGLGAVSPIPFRSVEAEKYLNNSQDFSDKSLWHAAEIAANSSSPISDVRCSAEYRHEMVKNMTYQSLRKNLDQLRGALIDD